MKKRIFISMLLLISLFGILFGGIFLIRKNTEKGSEKKEAKEKILEVDKAKEEIKKVEERKKENMSQQKIEFENGNILDDFFSQEEIESLKEEMKTFLQQNETAAPVKKATAIDIYETQNQIRVYFTLDNESLLFVSYKKEEKSFFFWTEEEQNAESAIREWEKQKEAETKAVDTSSWEEEQVLPIEWNESGQENIPVILSGKEKLQGKIPEEELNCLETELQKFLEQNNELRREISIPTDKIMQTDREITFEADFITARIDKKNLQVTYHIQEGKFGFSLQ